MGKKIESKILTNWAQITPFPITYTMYDSAFLLKGEKK